VTQSERRTERRGRTHREQDDESTSKGFAVMSEKRNLKHTAQLARDAALWVRENG
jgi:hypothetical protein